jgi:hypothetical protein
MPLRVASRRRSVPSLEREFGKATFVDVTSRAEEPWVQLSPFYPHGGIPVPFTAGVEAVSVEGIWQGLKVFRDSDVDATRFNVASMSGLKRSVRRFGPVLGHRRGVGGSQLLEYRDARRQIYLPCYRFVLEHRVPRIVERLRRMSGGEALVVLLDYGTNERVDDTSKPLSHAGLVRAYVEERWPDGDWPTKGT